MSAYDFKVGDRVVVRNPSPPNMQILGVWTIEDVGTEMAGIVDDDKRLRARVPLSRLIHRREALVTVIPTQLVQPIADCLVYEMTVKGLLKPDATVAQVRDIAAQVCQLIAMQGDEEEEDDGHDPNRVH